MKESLLPFLCSKAYALFNQHFVQSDQQVFGKGRNRSVGNEFLPPVLGFCAWRKHFHDQRWVEQRIQNIILKPLFLSAGHDYVRIGVGLRCRYE
jgi:hypothetical protein